MKPNVNYIPREQLEAIAEKAGCILTPMAACIKVSKGKSANKMYIATTKLCARVDLSNFDHTDKELVRDLGGEKFGRVHQMLRFDRPVADVKAAFKILCEGLEGFTSHPKVKSNFTGSFRGSKKKNIETVLVVNSKETPKEHMERLVKHFKKIQEYSKQIGIPVSPKTIKEYEDTMSEVKKKIKAEA